MTKPNLKELVQKLANSRDAPIDIRNKYATNLEEGVNQKLKPGEEKVRILLGQFDEEYAKLNSSITEVTDALTDLVSDPIDEPEVDEVMKQLQREKDAEMIRKLSNLTIPSSPLTHKKQNPTPPSSDSPGTLSSRGLGDQKQPQSDLTLPSIDAEYQRAAIQSLSDLLEENEDMEKDSLDLKKYKIPIIPNKDHPPSLSPIEKQQDDLSSTIKNPKITSEPNHAQFQVARPQKSYLQWSSLKKAFQDIAKDIFKGFLKNVLGISMDKKKEIREKIREGERGLSGHKETGTKIEEGMKKIEDIQLHLRDNLRKLKLGNGKNSKKTTEESPSKPIP